ncbi:MAG TPA: TldD/PmbA family protein [Acidimicrobiales bacterium]|nr:TldD/PmbA family protein [Acidimicrobiales bacterium]
MAADTLLDRSVAEATIAAALRRGGDFAEVFAEDRSSTGIGFDDGRVSELASSSERGVGIRVVVGETTGFAHTSDLSEAGLLAAAETAAAVAREGGGGTRTVALEERSLPRSREVERAPESVAKQTKVDLLRRADTAAREAGGSIAQVMASYNDSRRRILVANSHGLLTSDDQVRTRFAVQCVASGDTGLQTGYKVLGRTIGFELFGRYDVEDAARTAAAMAISKLTARPAPAGVLPVVLDKGAGGILFHEACGHGLEADAILKDSSVYAHRVGQLVASPLVTLLDDGTIAEEWGNIAIDDEGNPAQRNVLIEDGVLTDYMWDFLRSRKEKRASSGNGRRQSYQHLPMVRMTNTYLGKGKDDPADIIAGTPHGVFVKFLSGGQVDTVSGDFVFGTKEAYLIENGRITEPLRDMNLIGNGPDILAKVDALGTDFDMSPGTCGKDGQSVPVGCGTPTLRVTGVTIGGTAGA